MEFKPESTWFNTSTFEVRILLLSVLVKFHSITSILFSVLCLLPKKIPKMMSWLPVNYLINIVFFNESHFFFISKKLNKNFYQFSS